MKKLFLTAALSLALAGGAYGAPAGQAEGPDSIEVIEAVVEENVTNVTIAQPDAEQAVPESAIAKKMTQAEKAHNAAVNDSWGGAITIIAMCIVISALAILSILFLCFGKISEALLSRNKRQTASTSTAMSEATHEADSGEAIAAIAMALAEHFGTGHDMEETILTIKRLKKSYSPWNSKIYNLRNMQDHRRNDLGHSAF